MSGAAAPIREARRRYPATPQVACFDTACHRGHPEVADRFALSEQPYRSGIRRCGFHGLSYEYAAGRLREVAPEIAEGRVTWPSQDRIGPIAVRWPVLPKRPAGSAGR